MRKLKLQVQMSVDGYIAGPNGEMDWMMMEGWNSDDKYRKYVYELTQSIDTILLGRKMTSEFISYWSDVMSKPDNRDYMFAKKMIEIPKIVFSKTLDKSEWVNTEISKGDLRTEITRIKNQQGRDIIVYGGASFDSSLIKEKLIDELYLFINPVALGKGMSIFKDLNEVRKFTLIESIVFDCGIVLLHYETMKN
jgi:dihydrofolate reductase